VVGFHQRVASSLRIAAEDEASGRGPISQYLHDPVRDRAVSLVIQKDVARRDRCRIHRFHGHRVAVANRGGHAVAVCAKPHSIPGIEQIATDLEERSRISRIVSQGHLGCFIGPPSMSR
jgi:hypothetical protein